jgi:hypothetical protein
MDLVEELAKLVAKLEEERIEYALCGGLAMAVYAFPRATLDIDLMLKPESLDHAKQVANGLGFSLDSGWMNFKGGAIKIYRLCKIVPESKGELILVLLLATPAVQSVWDSRQKVTWEHGTLSVVSPQGLITLKSLRGSGQDQDDIAFLKGIADET